VTYVEQIRTTVRVAAVAEAELDARPDVHVLLRAFRAFSASRSASRSASQ
jgi:hypothetical protein